MLGHTVMERYPGFETTEMFAVLRQCMEERTARTADFEFTYPDSTAAWFEFSIQPVPEGLLILSLDITARRRSEEDIRALNADLERRVQERTAALRESEERSRQLAAAIPDSVVVVQDGSIVHANSAGARMLHFAEPEELAGVEFSGVIVPEHRPQMDEYTSRMLAGEKLPAFEGGYLSRDGSLVAVEMSTSLMTWEGRPSICIVARDITERKRLEAQVAANLESLADFKAALDQHAIVAITDRRGKITYVNDKFCAISGYSREELIGQDHRIINSAYHPKTFIRELWLTIASGQVWKGEIKNRAKDGTFYWVATTIVPFLDERGKPEQYIAIRADITERKLAEEQIAELNATLQTRATQLAEANKELETFSYSVSHDLRAPLRHVQGYVEMLTRATEGQLSPKAAHYLKTITDASVEMGQLIDDLLDFSRMGRAEMRETVVDLDRMVQDTLRRLEMTTAGRHIVWKIGPLPSVRADPAMLQQVLANLIGNAVKYSRKRDPAEIEVGCAGEEDGRIIICVHDNGAGFEMQYAHKLFGVFQRLHRAEEFEGTGIGLATVRRIVTRHGGRVWAEGKLDEGASFSFTLRPATRA